MIRLENVSFSYGKRQILDSISLEVKDGEILVILGANGEGKSTLAKIMSGLLKSDSGKIFYENEDISKMSNMALARSRAVLEQESPLSFDYTVAETVELSLYSLKVNDTQSRISSALAQVGLAGFEKRKYSQLSGGEKRRTQMARALCQLGMGAERKGKNLILDEPSAGLDPAHSNSAMQAAIQVAKDGASVVAILHDPNLAVACASKIAVLKDGKIFAMGKPNEIMDSHLLSQAYSCKCQILESKGVKMASFPPS